MTTDNELIQAIDQALDERSLAWASKWIEDSLQGETNERVIEFGRNMAMTLRAAANDPASTAPVVDGDVIDVLDGIKGFYGTNDCWCDSEGDATHFGHCIKARALYERLKQSSAAATAAPQVDDCDAARVQRLEAQMQGLLNSLANSQQEVERLRAGNFTPQEFQNLCHNLDESDREVFVAGCLEYQRKLFGDSATAAPVEQSDETAALRDTNILCRSGEGRPKVEIWFKDLKAAQRVHKWLVSLAAITNEGAR